MPRRLSVLQSHARPVGIAVVNVLTEGATYLNMFSPAVHCLFKPEELRERFAAWQMLSCESEVFPAPGNTRKVFSTAIARKPGTARADD